MLYFKMMHIMTPIIALLCVTLASASAEARDPGAALHAEVGTRLALGDWADISGPGFGGTLGFHYTVIPSVTLTARAGYFAGLPKTSRDTFLFITVESKAKTNEIPILLGGRFYLPGTGGPGELWGGIEAGMTQLTLKYWIENDDGERNYIIDDNELEPTVVLGLGYDLGQLNPHVAMHWIPIEDNDDFFAIVLTLGFDLARF